MKAKTILLAFLAATIVGVALGRAQAANVALGKPATGTMLGGWHAPMAAVTDGVTSDTPHVDLGDRWLDNYWLAPGGATGAGATFTLDLLGVYDISEINLVNTRNLAHGVGDSGTNAFQLSTSEDGVTFTSLLNSSLPESNTPTLYTGLSRSARFLKFQADSYYSLRAGLAEIEVEGMLDTSKPFDLAAGKPTSGIALGASFPTSAVNDGLIQDLRRLTDSPVVNSYWLAQHAASGPTQYFEVDLEGLYQVSEFVAVNTVNHRSSGSANGDSGTADFQILVSTDGVNFTTVVDDTLTNRIGANPNNSIPEYFTLSTPVEATHVRFQVDSYYGSRGGLSEFAVISHVVPEPSTLVLLATGLLGLLLFAWRRRRRR